MNYRQLSSHLNQCLTRFRQTRISVSLRIADIALKEVCSHIPKPWLFMAGLLPLSGIVAAVAVTGHGEEQVKVERIVERLPLPKFKSTPDTVSYWREEPVLPGDSVSQLLIRLGVDKKEANSFMHNSPISADLLRLRAGSTVSVKTNSAGQLFAMQFLNDDDNGETQLVAIEQVNGKWQASSDDVDSQTLSTIRAVRITTSATGALAQAGVPVEVRAQLNEIFSERLDINQLKEGDGIRLVYETFMYNGKRLATGNVLAAEIERAGQHYDAYYYAHDGLNGAYYNAAGEPLKQGFNQEPVAGARISSPFGIRMHPILRTIKMHSGIDYAVRHGTPIVSPADGVVSFVGPKGGYGNAVMITHGNAIQTLYGHMSDFKYGLQAGRAVKAGDLIGYVGSTGRSTGPHLHFEVRRDGYAVDPASTALPSHKLNKTELADYRMKSALLVSNIALLRQIPATSVAQLD